MAIDLGKCEVAFRVCIITKCVWDLLQDNNDPDSGQHALDHC